MTPVVYRLLGNAICHLNPFKVPTVLMSSQSRQTVLPVSPK